MPPGAFFSSALFRLLKKPVPYRFDLVSISPVKCTEFIDTVPVFFYNPLVDTCRLLPAAGGLPLPYFLVGVCS